ncbi:MAG TPA: isoprenylcysteine carboxylmethyltransferase family protein [Ignavibacteriaceae bacterium]|nr:isoprenylcysteine carboxylmethyltransferase family protein [Ignavibacteriaceae bacterium]
MKNLGMQAFGGFLFLFLIMSSSIFLPAWTFNYWQAWTFLAVFFAPVLAITIYLMKKDPKLLERRVRGGPSAEKEKSQQVIQSIAGIAFIAIFLVSALDHRFGWSEVSLYIVVAGDVLVVLGLLVVFFVFRENTFTSATIEIATDQKVISTGPYSLVRHPMYSGAFIMLLGVPIALGSWWGLLAVIPLILVIVARLFDEEKFLAQSLVGYPEYLNRVLYRLIPFVW